MVGTAEWALEREEMKDEEQRGGPDSRKRTPGRSDIYLRDICEVVPVWWPGNKNSLTVTHACRKRRLKWIATLPLGDINNTEAWSSGMRVGRGANNPTLQKRKFLRSLQEIQPDFVEEAKA
jgi:hypothetical protein